MTPMLWALLFTGTLFLGMLALLEVGRRIAVRRTAKDPEGAHAGVGTMEGSVFGLLGLLIAFTFSGAAARFDARRELIVQEANAVGTAYLRLDLCPASVQPALRTAFRDYLDARLDAYRSVPNMEAVEAALARSVRLQGEIWTRAVAECAPLPAPMLLLPALNEMFDITTVRTTATRVHPPPVIFGLLFALALGCSLLAGYGMAGSKTRSWTHMIAFAAITAVTVYVILDIEYPRLGLVRVDAADRVLVEVRESMR